MASATGGLARPQGQQEARKVESLVLARLLEGGRAPGSKRIPTLADFSNRFFNWLETLPADRPPRAPTRRYYQVGWRILESTPLACMKLDHITTDHASTIEGSSAANTNNALRTLRRLLKKAHEWQLLSYSASCETRRGTRTGRAYRPVYGAAAANSHSRPAVYTERQRVAGGLGAVPNDSIDHAGFRSSTG
jgi:hypothetical protein